MRITAVRITSFQATWLAAGLGVICLLLGFLLVAKNASSYSGSPVGWFLIACGVIGLLTALAIVAGAYRE